MVSVVARGIPTPTSIAFLEGQTFVAGFGDEQHPKVTGGVYLLKGGKPVKVAGSPAHVFGLASAGGTLYVSGGTTSADDKILAWSGWNGTRFMKSRVVVAAPKGFTSFNGLAIGPDGMLYTGVSLGDKPALDHTKGTSPYANDVLRVDPASGAITVQATGLRQPWQLTFAPGSKAPFVSELGQENLGKKRPPDYVVEATEGSDFGFPECPAKPASCSKYTKHFAQFPAHSSPMGLGVLGSTLYIALFGGTGKGPRSSRCLPREEHRNPSSPALQHPSSHSPSTPARSTPETSPAPFTASRRNPPKGGESIRSPLPNSAGLYLLRLLTLYSVSVTTDNASHRRQDGTTSSCAANCDVPPRPHRDHQIMFLSLAHQNPRTRKSGQIPVRSCRPTAPTRDNGHHAEPPGSTLMTCRPLPRPHPTRVCKLGVSGSSPV